MDISLEQKKQEMTKRVKEKLDFIGYRVTAIFTNFDKEGLLRDGTKKELLTTTFLEPILDRTILIHSDVETLEMLYVQTGPMNFVDIDDFFKLK